METVANHELKYFGLIKLLAEVFSLFSCQKMSTDDGGKKLEKYFSLHDDSDKEKPDKNKTIH